MKRPSAAFVALTVFWIAYGIGAAWVLYESTPPLSRDVVEILVGYGGMLAIVTAAIVLRARVKRSRVVRGS